MPPAPARSKASPTSFRSRSRRLSCSPPWRALLNVLSTRLARVADKVDATAGRLDDADPAEAARLSRYLSYLRRRSFILDGAVVLASLGAVMTGISVLTLFLGALRDATTASVLFACFGIALLCTIAAIGAFLTEILVAGRGVRVEVARGQDQAANLKAR